MAEWRRWRRGFCATLTEGSSAKEEENVLTKAQEGLEEAMMLKLLLAA